jgi:hypothetical protein
MILAISLLTAVAVLAADQDRFTGEGMFIATTGKIVTIDLQNRMLRVHGSDGEPSRHYVQTKHHFSTPIITFPHGLSIHIPLRVDRNPSSKTSAGVLNLDEYTVVITNKTLIQDGADPIRLEDFTEGETVSIHGVLNGNVLTASRFSKWS